MKKNKIPLREAIALAMNDGRYNMQLAGEDMEMVRDAVNQGIDAHLEAITDSEFVWVAHMFDGSIKPADLVTEDDKVFDVKLLVSMPAGDLFILMRRLSEMEWDSETDDPQSLIDSILTTLDLDEEYEYYDFENDYT